MAVPFTSVPSNLLVPMVAAEFDASRAQQGPSILAHRALLIGQKRTAGTAAANALLRVSSEDQVLALAGRGSMLHRMAMKWFRNNRFTELWIGVLDDNAAGVAATGTLTATGPATAAGPIALYLGGELVQVAVANGDSASIIATNIAAAINAAADLPVTAAAALAVVTVTHRHKGAVSNDFDMRVNYQDGEKLPAGVGVAVVAMANGATNPVLTTLLASLGDSWFNEIVHPYADATGLTAIEGELASRAGPMRMIDGVAFTSAVGTQATLAALGDGRNSQYSVILAQGGKAPLTPPCEFAAAAAAVVAASAANDPARPFQYLPIAGVKAPAESDRFTNAERNLLLLDGVATSRVAVGGEVQLERVVTTYQLNAAGAADTAWRDATTVFTMMYLRYAFRTFMARTFPRHKLASDGTRFSAGQPIVTPMIAKAAAVAWFHEMESLGLVEGFDQFKRDLVVERDPGDANRLNFLLPPDVINGLVVLAANIQFRL